MVFDHSKINSWDDVEEHKNEVLPYLKNDLVSMQTLMEQFSSEMYESVGVNCVDYLTLPSLSESVHVRMLYSLNKKLTETDKKAGFNIEIPNKKKYEVIRSAIFGGRVTCYTKHFKTKIDFKNYEELKNSGDFIYNADVSSLYPTAMVGNDLMKVAYPVGVSRFSTNPKAEFENNKLGFYEIEYEPPTNINYPALPKRKENGGIEWNLLPGRGTYTNVDIEDAISIGYKIKFVGSCLVYDHSRSDLFSEYVGFWYDKKAGEDLKPEDKRNMALREIAKLMMNSLYGKTLQKAHFTNQTIINNTSEAFKFLENHHLTDLILLGNGKVLIKGEVKEINEDDKITKPSQIGAFILSYSRRLMMMYNKILDPTLKSVKVTYTDTDSMHISGMDYFKLKELELIRNGELGYLSNDIKKDGIIFEEINLGSKLYMYKYINKEEEIKTVMKCKGLPKKYLKEEFFRNEIGEITIKDSFKKIFNQTKEEKNNNMEIFSIRKIDIKRKFNKTQWSGRILKGNIYYPIGYTGEDL